MAGFDREQLYLALFQVFDKDSSGLIDPRDLHEIALALNKDPEQGRSSQTKLSFSYQDSLRARSRTDLSGLGQPRQHPLFQEGVPQDHVCPWLADSLRGNEVIWGIFYFLYFVTAEDAARVWEHAATDGRLLYARFEGDWNP